MKQFGPRGAPRWQHHPPVSPILSPLLPQSAQHVACPPLAGFLGQLKMLQQEKGVYTPGEGKKRRIGGWDP